MPQWQITVRLDMHDIWIGLYWKRSTEGAGQWENLDLYICVVPMLPIRIHLHKRVL